MSIGRKKLEKLIEEAGVSKKTADKLRAANQADQSEEAVTDTDPGKTPKRRPSGGHGAAAPAIPDLGEL